MKRLIIIVLQLSILCSACKRDDIQSKPLMAYGHKALAENQSNNSIYQLKGSWTDQNGKQVSLNDLKGKVQIVAMIFTHCAVACPMIVEEMKNIRDALPGSDKNKVGFVLFSFDSERDTSGQLKRFALQRNLDDHWVLLHGNEDQVRELSMVLNVQYKKLDDGNFIHSSIITILDRQGNIVLSHEGFGEPDKGMIAGISKAVGS